MLCCPYCFYENLHEKHKVLKVTDEESLKIENITLESSSKEFGNIINNIKKLKEKIEEEINKINNLYEETIAHLTKAFQEKHEQLLKQENDLKEKLQNEVTKTKEKLEYFFSESNNEILLNERINAGLKNLEKEEKNNLRILSYISQMNKNNKEMIKLSNEKIKGKNFYYNEKENNIIYKEYIFNGIPIPQNIQFKDISRNSITISWDFDNKDILEEKILYIVEMKKENKDEKFKEIYRGNETNYKINNLIANTYYEFRICISLNECNGLWTQIQKIQTKANNYNELDNSLIIKNIEEEKIINDWISTEGIIKDIKLLYRATDDGDSSNKVIEKIKNKGPIITLIKTKKNKRFGGFTMVDWEENGGKMKDSKAFLFSLDNKAKYKILNSSLAFVYFSSNPLCYGNNSDGKGVYLNDHFLNCENNEDQSSRVYEVPSDNCLSGEKLFRVDEVEIFQIIFEK